jgi:hypothetical protein
MTIVYSFCHILLLLNCCWCPRMTMAAYLNAVSVADVHQQDLNERKTEETKLIILASSRWIFHFLHTQH